MILAALLAIAPPAPCHVSHRWTVIPRAGHLPWISELRFNKVTVIDGRPAWNGTPVDDRTLRSYGRQAARLNPKPMMVLRGYRVACRLVQRYAALLEDANGCDRSYCVLSFDPYAPGTPPPPLPHRRKR